MNERIKSLLAQAHLEIKEEFGIIDTNQVAERFATLIIDECISELDYYDGAYHHSVVLKQHFGIE